MAEEDKASDASEMEQLRMLLQKLSVMQHAPTCTARLTSSSNFVEFVDWRTAIERYRLEGGVAPLSHFVRDELHPFVFAGCEKTHVYAHFRRQADEDRVFIIMAGNILPKLTEDNHLLCIRKVTAVLSSCHMRHAPDDELGAALTEYTTRFDKLAKWLPEELYRLLKEKKVLRLFANGLTPRVRVRAEMAIDEEGIKTLSGLRPILERQLDRWAADIPPKTVKRRPTVEVSSSRVGAGRFTGTSAASGRLQRRGGVRKSGGGGFMSRPSTAASPRHMFGCSAGGKKLCYRCGRDNHLRDDCAARRDVNGEEIKVAVGRNVPVRQGSMLKRVARSDPNPERPATSIGARVHQRHVERKGAGDEYATCMVKYVRRDDDTSAAAMESKDAGEECKADPDQAQLTTKVRDV